MKEIDLSTWERKEHFDFFHRTAYPLYNITFDLDVTYLKHFTKANHLSFNYSLIHISISCANMIDNFKYRIHGDSVILHEVLHPSFASISPGSSLFKLVTVDFIEDIFQFNSATKEIDDSQKTYFPIEKLVDRDDFVFFSSLPWITFTSVDHTVNLNGNDAIPRISWGKYYEKGNRLMIPYNMQVNHCFVDGYHLGLFKDLLDQDINKLGKHKSIIF